MRLYTLNILTCLKCKGFPLTLSYDSVGLSDGEVQAAFVMRLLPSLHWESFVKAVTSLPEELVQPLPETAPLSPTEDQIAVLYKLLYLVNVMEGSLSCQCGARYPIRSGVPNFLIAEES